MICEGFENYGQFINFQIIYDDKRLEELNINGHRHKSTGEISTSTDVQP